jgi:D-3-phosphoglycerate dehydrogenase
MTAVVVGPFDPTALESLRALVDVVRVPETTPAAVRPHLPGAHILITRRVVVDAVLLDAAPRLRLIVKPGSGFDEIDVAEATRRGSVVHTTPDVNAPAVAELTLGLIVNLVCRIPDHHVRLHAERRWNRDQGTEFYGQTLGIPLVPYDEVLARSDVVSFHVPLTEETRSMIDARALSRMRPGAYVINMSRGEIADEAAVIEALDAGRLAGYAADVLSGEVPGMIITSPLLDHSRVLLTPHLGAWTAQTDCRVCQAAVSIVRRWLTPATTGH